MKDQCSLAEKVKDEVLTLTTLDTTPNSIEDENQTGLIGRSVLKQKKAESGGKLVWRIANGLMTLFFVMAVGVQFNDPDPYLWVPLYGTAALLTVCATVQPEFTGRSWWRHIYWIHAVFCIGMFFYVFIQLVIVAANPEADGSLNPLTYEEGREMAGVMITVVWLFTCKQSPTIKSKSEFRKELAVGILIIVSSLLPLSLWAMCYYDAMSPSYISFCGDYFMGEFSF